MGGDKKLFTPGPLNTSMAVKVKLIKLNCIVFLHWQLQLVVIEPTYMTYCKVSLLIKTVITRMLFRVTGD